jgi:hypothetical protein
MFYLAGYLLPTGAGLLLAPRFTLKLLFSNNDYGEVFPRVAGMLLIGLGIIVVQLIRLRNDILYPTTMMIRIFFCVCIVVFYYMTRDPLFLVMLGVIGLGLIITSTCYVADRAKSQVS